MLPVEYLKVSQCPNRILESPFDSLPISVLEMKPQIQPSAVVYLVHGLCGCKERFIPFMEYLTENGIACVASDHRGHGDSILKEEDRGYMYQGGVESILADMEAVSFYIKEYYKDIPGQWGTLRFWAGSKDNILNNVVVKNATIGILVDTCVTNNPTIEMMNTRIENCSYIGLYSRGAVLDMKNSLIQNCGNYNLALTLGGSYQFVHCTFANYYNYKTRTTPLLYFNDYYLDVNENIQHRQIENAEFYNCIIYGALADSEIEFDMIDQSFATIRFDYCLAKYEGENQNTNLFTNSILNQDPMFVEPSEGDLHLQENSPCIGKGNGVWGYNLPYDIEGNLRLDPPSIGAYEYKPLTNQKILRKKIK